MKIIICINQMSKGGAERVVANLSNYLCNNNEVMIISLDKKDIGYNINNKVDIKFVDDDKDDNKLLKNIKRINRLKEIYVKEKADVVLTFLPESSFLTLMLKNKIKSKVIVSVRNDPKIEYKSIIYKILMKMLYPKANGYVFQTEDAKNYFNKKIKSKSKVIFNSLNPEFMVEPYAGEREKTIVTVGRLSEQKNHELLIYAFSKIHKEYPDYKLVIYGEGHLRSKYEQLIKELDLEEYITLPGVTDDIKSRIYKAGIFVLSSDYEGMPNVLMEALAMGIPCISTDCPCGGPKTLIDNGNNGILVEVGNEDMLVDKLNTIINDSEFAKRISLNNIEMRKKFNPEIINKEWEEYISDVYRRPSMKNLKRKLEFFCIRLARKKIIPMSDKKFLNMCFDYFMEKKINWEFPKTYNEKLQWLKIHDRKDIYTKLVDKYEMKEYISKFIGKEYVIPTIGIYDKFDDIDFEKLPDRFVLKCTHDSGGLIICKDKNNFDIKEAKRKINKCLKINYYYGWREWPYKNVKPRIIIEPYIEEKKYNELRDYKFFCFNGKVKLMFVASNRQGNGDTYFDFFDNNYEHLNIINGHPNAPMVPDKPLNFKKMIEIAEKLSKDFLHIRVDFYEVNGKIYVGELTFYHWSGMVPFLPDEWDKKIGDLLNLKGKENES